MAGLDADRRVLVPALVDGDDAGLDPALADDFRTTGLTHLLAVSGTNLTLVVGFALVVARWLRRARALAATLVGAAGIVGFVLLARAEPSVLRAAVMGTVALLGMGANGRDRGTRALGVATVLLLLLDPGLASAMGFALSVLATAGILLLAPGWRDALARWLPRVAGRGGRRPDGGPARLHAADRGDLGAGEPGRGAGQPPRRTGGRPGHRAGPGAAAC